MNNSVREEELFDPFSEALVRSLFYLAATYREQKSIGDSAHIQRAVEAYHQVMTILWEHDWRGKDLLPEEELPDHLMPRFYMEYWHRSVVE